MGIITDLKKYNTIQNTDEGHGGERSLKVAGGGGGAGRREASREPRVGDEDAGTSSVEGIPQGTAELGQAGGSREGG